jgi:hypothetical protein
MLFNYITVITTEDLICILQAKMARKAQNVLGHNFMFIHPITEEFW